MEKHDSKLFGIGCPSTTGHNYSDPVEMAYVDGVARYPYAVSVCRNCGNIVKAKVQQEV